MPQWAQCRGGRWEGGLGRGVKREGTEGVKNGGARRIGVKWKVGSRGTNRAS